MPTTKGKKCGFWGDSMYCAEDKNQLSLEDFILPFGGHLNMDNRWVKLARIMPWDYIDEVYAASMCPDNGRRAYSSRIAYGALFIKKQEKLSDEMVPVVIQENPYMQYFLGLHEFTDEPLFDSSMLVHFRKRFPVEDVAKINEMLCTGKRPEAPRNVDRNDHNDHYGNGFGPSIGAFSEKTNEKEPTEIIDAPHSGKLIMDATVAPADIKFPTDIDLLNKSREHLETAIRLLWNVVPHSSSEHMLPYFRKAARAAFLALSKSKKWTAKKCRKAIEKQLDCIEKATARLNILKEQRPDWEKYLPSWLLQRLSVIPEVYAQQKGMFDSGTHTCANRICSISQPHVRPIVRGKRPNPTEFGQKLHLSVVNGFTYIEQTCWHNYNEGCDLCATVLDYYRKFGCLPEAILADRIYQTRENRKFCKMLSIRLSGPPLGRVKEEVRAEVRTQMYKDACERNAVEGRNGNAKRRYGLDLIMAKLDETAKTDAAFSILVMNAAAKLAQLLSQFWGCRVLLVFQ